MRSITPSEVKKVQVNAALFTGPLTQQALLSSSENKDFKASIINFPKGIRNKFHTHDSDQLLIVTEGTGLVVTDEEEKTVTVGDVIYIPAGEKHWHGANADSDFSHISITPTYGNMTQLED
jgi:quercetin dioxygenase-like cupin family protein